MSWRHCLFSKLIEACEMEWIPEADALYGEHLGAIKNSTELKQLIYRPSAKERAAKKSFLKAQV